jgi:hypothetical protein
MDMPYDEEYKPVRRRFRRHLRWAIVAIIALVAIWIVIGQTIIWFWLNITEFGDIFIRRIYFEILGGLILATIALFRIDFVNRRSLTWWVAGLFLRLTRQGGMIEEIEPEYFNFKAFKLSPIKFALWQVTKVLLGTAFFTNVIFGMSIQAMMRGWNSGIDQFPRIFGLPFITPPFDLGYAGVNVIPLIPSLTLIIPPLIGALGIRLLLLVGVTELLGVFVPSLLGIRREGVQATISISTIEALIALGLFWTLFNLFFSTFIDYNTKVMIIGLGVGGIIFTFFSIIDRRKGRFISAARRRTYLRILAVVVIALTAGSTIAIQDSIADARKVEWLGPYTVQEIAVNRYFAQLDRVKEVPYNFSIVPISAEQIDMEVTRQGELLKKIRLWDWKATFAKLKPEIGLIPYIDFQDSDIIRFNNTLYWSASMKPVLPSTVLEKDKWYTEHLVYTHVPVGFLILDGHEGVIVNTTSFFDQRRIYYGEGGLLKETWAAYLAGRQSSDEVGGYFYRGEGGIDVSPPLSWVFEPNFFLAYTGQTVHVLRYRDVYDRMQTLFPYFLYNFGGKPVDMYPVTDGTNTYWLMPLIVGLDARMVPWSNGNPVLRFVGYSLIDIYDGDIQLIILGDDYFSELFKKAYSEYVTTEVPSWLNDQTRYPEELFEWRVSMYNYYHVTDAGTFIVAKEFFEVPEGLDTYYIIAKPPGFDKSEFIALLSLELRGAQGRNLAGYMVVRNDYPELGEMIFYEVSLEATTKLLGPTAVIQALEKNSEFATLRTLLRSPRVGDNILYRVGEHDVYFIPVYTAGAGGVVTELGTIAAVGATFTGQYHVGLGNSAEEAFRDYLIELAGVEIPPEKVELGKEQRIQNIISIFEGKNLTIVEPTSIDPIVSFLEGETRYVSEDERSDTETLVSSFIDEWVARYHVEKVLMWTEDSAVNFGVFVGVELHYITITFD